MSKVATFYTTVAEQIAWNFYDGSVDATGMITYIAESFGTSLIETCGYIEAILLPDDDSESMMPSYVAADDFSDIGQVAYNKAVADLAEAAAVLHEYLDSNG
tara:strand:- start:1230 stop:1535 length:306 start_codon:yes stop_codon:yes gene_type:complete